MVDSQTGWPESRSRLGTTPLLIAVQLGLEGINWHQIVIIPWASSLLKLLEDACSVIIRPGHKKGLPISSKRQLIRFLQFTAWSQQILREREILLRLEAKLRCILNRCINHLVCQLDRTHRRFCLSENFAKHFVLITNTGKTRIGKRIFNPQAVLIYQVDPKTDLTIRLLPGQK